MAIGPLKRPVAVWLSTRHIDSCALTTQNAVSFTAIMTAMLRLDVPERFRQNSHMVRAAGYDETALNLMGLMAERLGLADFSQSAILDVGCGTRFSSALLNHRVPVGSYTGVDVNSDIITFLQENATPLDVRFQYYHWDVRNSMYNTDGEPMREQQGLPAPGKYDVIWLFSVFTHLNPEDAAAMLFLLRRHVSESGSLVFTVRLNPEVDRFVDRVANRPLLRAVFSPDYMQQLIQDNGWKIEGFYEKDPRDFIRSYFICSPDFSVTPEKPVW
ncbi:MAG: methyltransferase domain-containing protein [Pseudomonadales bacterium]|nr:methyltransferase domain-containing protein [Pseudomonadales bacterium]